MSDAGSQKERFIEAAREVGADDDAEAFKAKLARIARQKVKNQVTEEERPNEP